MIRDRTAIMTTSTLWLLIITWESTFRWPSNEPDTSLPDIGRKGDPAHHESIQQRSGWPGACGCGHQYHTGCRLVLWLPETHQVSRARARTLELDEWYDYEMQIFLPVSILSLFVSTGLRAYWCTIARRVASTRSTGVKLVWTAFLILHPEYIWIFVLRWSNKAEW